MYVTKRVGLLRMVQRGGKVILLIALVVAVTRVIHIELFDTILPMSNIVRSIEINPLDQLGVKDLPPPVEPVNDLYSM